MSGANSLYETASGAGDLTLVDQAFANAEGGPVGSTPAATAPKAGYVFASLTGQGASGPGGAKVYIVNGNMTIGYSISAVPMSWDGSGRNSFMLNNTGTVYQNDRGISDVAHMTVYDPGTGWVVSE